MSPEPKMLILHHDWDSLQSMKVRMCLEEKGLAFESRVIDLAAFEHLRPDYLAINGAGLVPSLVDGGHVITESTIINEFLEDSVPTGLRPESPLQRARTRAWTKYQDDEVHPAIRPATFQLMIRRRLSTMTTAQIDALVASHPLPQRAAAFREWATMPSCWMPSRVLTGSLLAWKSRSLTSRGLPATPSRSRTSRWRLSSIAWNTLD
jgi:glutathione S-transferase